MNPTVTCERCEGKFPPELLTEFDGAALCPECLTACTLLCSHCEERIWREENEGNEQTPLCRNCYEESYTHCTRCGGLISDDETCYYDEEPYCSDCRDRLLSDEIHSYNYKPDPIFYGDGPRYFGVELEIDCGGEDLDSAGKLLFIGNREQELIYCKHDGSLDDGFEIVTHPMSLDWHLHQMPWEAILNKAVQMGYLSHRANTCGLHVHVSRDAFGFPGRDRTVPFPERCTLWRSTGTNCSGSAAEPSGSWIAGLPVMAIRMIRRRCRSTSKKATAADTPVSI